MCYSFPEKKKKAISRSLNLGFQIQAIAAHLFS